MIVDRVIPLWANPGTANITIANGNIYAFWPYHGVTPPPGAIPPTAASPNNGFSNADFGVQPNYWFHIPCQGADYVVLQYQSKLEAVGTITNVASSFLTLGVQGKFYSPSQHPSLRIPQVVRAASNANGNTGNPEWSPWEMKVQRISWGREHDINFGPRFSDITANGGTEHATNAIFLMGNTGGSNATNAPLGVPVPPANPPATRTPTTNDYPGWAVFIQQRNHNVPNGGTLEYPSMGGVADIWVYIASFMDFAGAGPIRILGEMHAILLRGTGGT